MELKVPDISARELLLNPIDLLHQISAAFLPGVLVLCVLALKGPSLLSRFALCTGMLGYKSRLVVALFLALIAGKIVQSAVLVLASALGRLTQMGKAIAAQLPKAESLQAQLVSGSERGGATHHEVVVFANGAEVPTPKLAKVVPSTKSTQESTRLFFTSLLMGTVLARDGSAFDSWNAARAQLGLLVNAGFILIFASFYPGDGLRAVEAVAGAALMIAGIIEARKLDTLRLQAIGGAVGQVIAAHSVKENLEILQMVAKVLPVVSKHINPTAEEKVPAEIVDEVIENASSKPFGSPQPNRKQRRGRR